MKINVRTEEGYLFAVFEGKSADKFLSMCINFTDVNSNGKSKIFTFNEDMLLNLGELKLMLYKGYFLEVVG